jgi:hypothetical protein
MEEFKGFEDMRYGRVSIDYPYIQKLTSLLMIKKSLDSLDEVDDFCIKILSHIVKYSDTYIDKLGICR